MNRQIGFHIMLLLLAVFILAGCNSAPTETLDADQIISPRSPLPTPTAGNTEQQLSELAESLGLTTKTVLGLDLAVWLSLLLSVLIVAGGWLLTSLLLRLIDRWAHRHMAASNVASLQRILGRQLRWFILIVLLYLATIPLGFINATLRRLLLDSYFVAGMTLLAFISWQTLTFVSEFFRSRNSDEARRRELEPVIVLASRLARAVLLISLFSILLTHFGINVVALSAAVGLGGLAISLAARDTVADAIAGMIILFDRPFRVGDRIEIEAASTWGDVVDIGLRTTRIRTRDNRLVIVPNSKIVANEIVNYSYPDPFYRIQLDVGVAYNTDIERVRQLFIDTTSRVDGVLAERGVDALYLKMGDSAMIFRVRWWIESYADTRHMIDRVNTALQHAFNTHNIETPFQTLTVITQTQEQNSE